MAEPASLEFRAMGSPCRIVVESGRLDIARAARSLVDDLERQWSRFRADSDVSAMNRAAGNLCVLPASTYDLVATAVRASQATHGRFNPLMLRQLRAHGYHQPWDLEHGRPSTVDGDGHGDRGSQSGGDDAITSGSVEPIELFPEISAVRLPNGCEFDPGGIGKGLAVDRAIELCRSAGSAFASVELGGDLRVYGAPWYGDRWTIAVADPFDDMADIATFTPTEGAVTTSMTTKRRWFDGTRWRHHLIDPSTGWPSESDLIAVTTCSTEAWWAEVVAKTALLAGSCGAVGVLSELQTPGVAVTESGRVLNATERSAEVPA